MGGASPARRSVSTAGSARRSERSELVWRDPVLGLERPGEGTRILVAPLARDVDDGGFGLRQERFATTFQPMMADIVAHRLSRVGEHRMQCPQRDRIGF